MKEKLTDWLLKWFEAQDGGGTWARHVGDSEICLDGYFEMDSLAAEILDWLQKEGTA